MLPEERVNDEKGIQQMSMSIVNPMTVLAFIREVEKSG
jgi:hypothetical protein